MFHQKIDLHAHFLPPAYYEYLKHYEEECPDHFDTPHWDIRKHIRQMNDLGTAFSFISVSSSSLPQLDDETEQKYIRKINEEGAAYAFRYPDRIGLMAELPLPNVTNALAEAGYALDVLGAYGFALKTHYRGKYLGSPEFDPLMEFLNKRKSVVVVHPAKPYGLYEGVNETLPVPAFEFLVETTRTFTNMVLKDLFSRYPDIRWVFPHGGAFISVLSDRMNAFTLLMKLKNPGLRADYFGAMKHVYFDLAGFPLPKQLEILRKDVPVSHMLYGSDSPYTPGAGVMTLGVALEETDQLSMQEKDMIFTGNALTLFPGLQNILDPDNRILPESKNDKPSGSAWKRKIIAFFLRHH